VIKSHLDEEVLEPDVSFIVEQYNYSDMDNGKPTDADDLIKKDSCTYFNILLNEFF
jgi:hypothetical protein